MKIYISADIEGITGVTHWDETDLNKADFSQFRDQMTAEVLAACQGALEAGAEEIWVKDAHDTARNIIASKLPKEVKIIRGWSGDPMLMVQELDKSFQAAILVGYHSRSGAGTSPLAHTMTGMLTRVSINGKPASEFLMHALAAAYMEVPVVFVSGDLGLTKEVSRFNQHITTVAVKQGIGNSTISLHPDVSVSRIREGVAKALKSDLSLCLMTLPPHFTVEVQYRRPYDAYHFGFYPGAMQKDDVTVVFEADDYFEVMRFFLFAA